MEVNAGLPMVSVIVLNAIGWGLENPNVIKSGVVLLHVTRAIKRS